MPVSEKYARMNEPPQSYTFMHIDSNGYRTFGCVVDGVVVHKNCEHFRELTGD